MTTIFVTEDDVLGQLYYEQLCATTGRKNVYARFRFFLFLTQIR